MKFNKQYQESYYPGEVDPLFESRLNTRFQMLKSHYLPMGKEFSYNFHTIDWVIQRFSFMYKGEIRITIPGELIYENLKLD